MPVRTYRALRDRLALRERSIRAGEASAAAAGEAAGVEPAPDTRAAAFFDLDNTLLRGASLFYLAKGMYRRKFLRTRDILRFGYQQARFRLGAENPEHVDSARAAALSLIAGRTVDELAEMGEQTYTEIMAEKMWPETLELAQQHLDQGQRVWLVTAAPVEVATLIAKRIGLTGALGTVAEHIDGTYTGRLVGDVLHGPAKAEAVRALSAREDVDLERCAAYSDSANDIPMLSLVGHPVAVNPDAALRAHAKQHGWQVRDYRGRRRNTAIGVAAGSGAVGGAVTGVVLARRRRR